MRASQDSITRILRRFGEHDLSIGIVSPVALYDVWLSRAGLSIDSLDQSSLDLLGSQLVRLGELVGDPATAVPGELWESSGLESHREGAVAMLNERLKIAQERYSMLVTATDSSSISTGPEMPRHADA
nr:hypothetical protein GCM10020092_048490 [Actinoplanes digitatis]